jgi:hypothetical protein
MVMIESAVLMKDSLLSIPSSNHVSEHGHKKSSLKKISKFQQPRSEGSVQGTITKGRRLSFADENGLTLETVKEFNSLSDSVGISTSRSIACVIS